MDAELSVEDVAMVGDRRFSFSLSPMFLSSGDSFPSGCSGLNDSRLVPIMVVDSWGLASTGTTSVARVSVVFPRDPQSWRWIRVRSRCGVDRVQLHWDKLPNSTRIGIAVIQEIYRLEVFARPVVSEVPGMVGHTPEEANVVAVRVAIVIDLINSPSHWKGSN